MRLLLVSLLSCTEREERWRRREGERERDKETKEKGRDVFHKRNWCVASTIEITDTGWIPPSRREYVHSNKCSARTRYCLCT